MEEILWTFYFIEAFDGMNLKQCQVDSILEQFGEEK